MTDDHSLRIPFIGEQTRKSLGTVSDGKRLNLRDVQDNEHLRQAPSSHVHIGCCSYLFVSFWDAIVHYWSITTDPIYQSSMSSRRPFWMFSFLVAGIYETALTLYQVLVEKGFYHLWWTNLMLAMSFVVCAFLPYRWKFADLFILFIQFGGLRISMYSFDPLSEPCYPLYAYSQAFNRGVFASATMSMSIGVHAYAGLVFLLFLFVFDILTKEMLVNYAVIVFFGGWMEYWLATLARNLRSERTVNEFLLDHATDGFCSVECATGIICSVSPHLEKTVGSCDLIGKKIMDVVDAGDHIKIQVLLESAMQGRDEMDPEFVSCTHLTAAARITFDAKIIAYPLSKDVLRFCMQVQGEFRSIKIEDIDEQEFDDNQSAYRGSDRSNSPPLSVRHARLRSQVDTFDTVTLNSLDFSVTDADACSNYSPMGRRRFLSSAQASLGHCCTASTQTVQTIPTKPSYDRGVQAGDNFIFKEVPKSSVVSALVSPRRGRSLERRPHPLRPPLPRPALLQNVSERLQVGLVHKDDGNPALARDDIHHQIKKSPGMGGRRKRLGHVIPPE